MTRKRTSREFCSVDPDGRVTDMQLHGAILDNPEADAAIAAQAMRRAMRRGLSREQAQRLYGTETQPKAR